jgi:hypothetical protein
MIIVFPAIARSLLEKTAKQNDYRNKPNPVVRIAGMSVPGDCPGGQHCKNVRLQVVNEAEIELVDLEDKWGKKYPVVIDSWKRNWDKLSTYFQYSAAIRKLIYTTNTIEGFHRQVRKVTKTKGAFPSDMSLLKLIYLATLNIQKKWTQPLQNWGLTVSQLSIKFGDRLKLKI